MCNSNLRKLQKTQISTAQLQKKGMRPAILPTPHE